MTVPDQAEQLDRLNAALADRYRIERAIGAGGMATVYLAEDLRHKRKVALKVLKPELAAVLGAERFVQEITTTASLQHPHILPLYDSGRIESFLYYVMPYIEGETLRDKLNREKQLAIEEAVRIATEVADALDYAHRNDVIHRDIKPENILLHDGRAMVADFGIALAVSAAAGGRMTETGLSVGTPHYMSPEQATAEKDLTNRSDIYSLGAVMYEMLTGSPPHVGSSAQQIIMKIVTEEPQPVRAVRRSVPPNVAAAVTKCLEKVPADRFTSAAEYGAALSNPDFVTGTTVPPSSLRAKSFWTDPRTLGLTAIAAIMMVVAIWGWNGRSTSEAGVRRITIPPPRGWTFLEGGYVPALSPDGNTVVFSARQGDSAMLFRRPLDGFTAEAIEGSLGAEYPFFSPDGVWVGFYTRVPAEIRKVPLAGGRPFTITPLFTAVNDATWRRDGTIVFSTERRGLFAVSDAGGEAGQLTVPDSAAGELAHHGPQELSDGRLFFGIRAQNGFRSAIMDADDGTWEVLPGDNVGGIYVPNGHMLIGTSEGVWTAHRFRIGSAELGRGIPVLTGAVTPYRRGGSGEPVPLSFSDRGDVAFFSNVREQIKIVTRLDSTGAATAIVSEQRSYRWPRVSPDGTRLSIGRDTEGRVRGLWVLNLRTAAWRRLPVDAGLAGEADWSPDGTRLAYTVQENSDSRWASIYVRDMIGAGDERLVVAAPFHAWMSDWSPDGRFLTFYGGPQNSAIWVADLNDGGSLRDVATGAGDRRHPAFSPDGRAIAYQSDESGRDEVYVRRFPELDDTRIVSTDGGTEPLWRSRRELVFRNGSRMMAVDIRTTPRLEVGTPRELFRAYMEYDLNGDRGYDIMPDGSFVVIRTDPVSAPDLRVIKGFVSELDRLSR